MAASGAGAVLLEARPFRPFKSSEEYLYAMKEDLAEWLTVLYPELRITADNFLDRLDTGVALCRHANAVRESARSVLARAEGAGGAGGAGADIDEEALALSRALRARAPVSFLPAARPGTFFARDNLSNFIEWCRRALGVLECLLFETDDLCLRKNERHVVLCLLEVARRGAVLGMPAPLLVQMERQIDRELAGGEAPSSDAAIGLAPAGPQAQVVTNDLRSLDERVRDLVARCSCPTQFPMVRVSEGKYRIGDTRLLIFVRILRSHVMVRVGGGWDTLAHYLDKHDPCRCRAAHRPTLAARLARPGAARPYADLSGATVLYERPEPASLPPYVSASAAHAAAPAHRTHMTLQNHSDAYRHSGGGGTEQPMSLPYISSMPDAPRRSSSPERAPRTTPRTPLAAHLSPSRSIRNRSGSPGRRSASPERRAGVVLTPHLVPSPHATRARSPRPATPPARSPRAATPPADGSDNGSEVSDEGYRSLGVVASPSAPAAAPPPSSRHSVHSQNSVDDADYSERLDTDDGCAAQERVDEHVSLSTGLRKTNYSGTLYGGGGARSKPASPAPSPPHPASPERTRAPSETARPAPAASGVPRSPARAKRTPPRPPPAARTTWAGRTAPAQTRAKARPALAADTFAAPDRSPPRDAFRRNSPLRASSATPRTGAPTKPLSPLLEQILRSTESARDDAGVLEKMKDIIRQYSGGGGSAPSGGGEDAEYADFTSAWVMSEGKLERSTSTRQLAAPRRDARGGASRIPAPLPAPLAARRSTSTTNFHRLP